MAVIRRRKDGFPCKAAADLLSFGMMTERRVRRILWIPFYENKEEKTMENRISVISIIIEDTAQAAAVNDLLHEYGSYIVGRMGIPYRERKVSIICIVMDAPGSVTSALSGKLGMLDGVSTKTVTTKASEA